MTWVQWVPQDRLEDLEAQELLVPPDLKVNQDSQEEMAHQVSLVLKEK